MSDFATLADPFASRELWAAAAHWLETEPGQQAIGTYKVDGEALFHPSATDPK